MKTRKIMNIGQKQTTKQVWDKKFITVEEIAVIVPDPNPCWITLTMISGAKLSSELWKYLVKKMAGRIF